MWRELGAVHMMPRTENCMRWYSKNVTSVLMMCTVPHDVVGTDGIEHNDEGTVL